MASALEAFVIHVSYVSPWQSVGKHLIVHVERPQSDVGQSSLVARPAGSVAKRIAVSAAEAQVIEIAGEAPHQWCVAALRMTAGSSRGALSRLPSHSSSDSDDGLLQPRSVGLLLQEVSSLLQPGDNGNATQTVAG